MACGRCEVSASTKSWWSASMISTVMPPARHIPATASTACRIGALDRREDAPAVLEQLGETRIGAGELGAGDGMARHQMRVRRQHRCKPFDDRALGRTDIGDDGALGESVARSPHRPPRSCRDEAPGRRDRRLRRHRPRRPPRDRPVRVPRCDCGSPTRARHADDLVGQALAADHSGPAKSRSDRRRSGRCA